MKQRLKPCLQKQRISIHKQGKSDFCREELIRNFISKRPIVYVVVVTPKVANIPLQAEGSFTLVKVFIPSKQVLDYFPRPRQGK